jgi:hypothetical protein
MSTISFWWGKRAWEGCETSTRISHTTSGIACSLSADGVRSGADERDRCAADTLVLRGLARLERLQALTARGFGLSTDKSVCATSVPGLRRQAETLNQVVFDWMGTPSGLPCTRPGAMRTPADSPCTPADSPRTPAESPRTPADLPRTPAESPRNTGGFTAHTSGFTGHTGGFTAHTGGFAGHTGGFTA